ncbi:MAG: M23 family metallopeptidase [Thermostichus sp. DG02_5_bins_236]
MVDQGRCTSPKPTRQIEGKRDALRRWLYAIAPMPAGKVKRLATSWAVATLLIFSALLYQFVNISPVFAQGLTESARPGSLVGLYSQLVRALDRQDWRQALRLVDELRRQARDPAQRYDLESYRLELEQRVYPPPPPPQPATLPFLHKPFAGAFPVSNLFDHDLPLGEADDNNRFLTVQGQVWIPNPSHPCGKSDGHAGYDWEMPIGTPILAAAAGRVSLARAEPEFYCPALGRSVRGLRVRILHELGSPEPQWFETLYTHLSEIQVREGQTVSPEDVIGLSGNSGCSSGPHLHFEVRRLNNTHSGAAVDPYGWLGSDLDPWSLHPHGAESLSLWQVGQAPSLGSCWDPLLPLD